MLVRVPVELVPPVVELEIGVVTVDVDSLGNVDGGNKETVPDAKDNIRKNERIEIMGEENLSPFIIDGVGTNSRSHGGTNEVE